MSKKVKFSRMTDKQLYAATKELAERQRKENEEYRERTFYKPRREAYDKIIAALKKKFGLSEDDQSEIYAAWRDFYDAWG